MSFINQVGNALTGASGTGSFAGTTSPSFTTPALGTPSAGVLSSCTGYAQSALTGLGTGVSTALGSNVTGSGGIALVTSPTFVTPILGAATATSINFGVTALSFYTEGTFTPTVVSSGGGSVTYTAQNGTYTLIGNKVFFNLAIVLSGDSLASGNITIAGLPIALGSGVQSAHSVYANNLATTSITQIMGQTGPGAPSVINMYKYATGSVTALMDTDITATTQFFISGHYTTST